MGTITGGRIDPQEVHEILRNSRRRRVIEQLSDRLGPVTLRELSEEIAAAETGETPPPRRVRDSVYNSLHQTHLPKLNDMGVIDYDQDRKTIRLRERAKQVNRYMRMVTASGFSWAQVYRTMGVIALISVIFAQVDAPVVGAIPVLLLASGFLGLFAIATAYQMWTLRWFYMRSVVSDPETSTGHADD
ncbi:putative trancriptional regulator, ArsR family [Halapricum desulfuricans]|uniref:Putative trancriptional regulator, ArsR family n=1 Tax=Halapricum desulfuricans TaxID=2841257 RepID=A0A897NG91_9EURY|nr:hypothetical protein [Halapricum desulfuricans]QSG11727.1 putative trancriptional regulator, ArsR family [Halapricum desulfuricans]